MSTKNFTREYFKQLTENLLGWEKLFTEEQLKIIKSWYIEKKSFQQIGRELGYSGSRIQSIVKGTNKFGKNSMFLKIRWFKNKESYIV